MEFETKHSIFRTKQSQSPRASAVAINVHHFGRYGYAQSNETAKVSVGYFRIDFDALKICPSVKGRLTMFRLMNRQGEYKDYEQFAGRKQATQDKLHAVVTFPSTRSHLVRLVEAAGKLEGRTRRAIF